MTQVSLLLAWSRKLKYIPIYDEPWRVTKQKRGQVKTMIMEECQAWIDRSWDTVYARDAILLLQAAIRPSELTKPGSHLHENLRYFEVGEKGKTGWRVVKLAPITQILLRILKEEGRLNAIGAGRTPDAWAVFRAEVGYPLHNSRMQGIACDCHNVPYGSIPQETAIAEYRGRWPQKFDRWIPDGPRHTCASCFCHSTGDDLGRTSGYLGNLSPTCKLHYRGRVSWEFVRAFYQLVPTQLKGKIDQNSIKMPSWYNTESYNEYLGEKAHVERHVVETVNAIEASGETAAGIKARLEKQRASMRRASAARLAKKGKPDNPEEAAAFEANRKAKEAAGKKACNEAFKAQGMVHRRNEQGSFVWVTKAEAECLATKLKELHATKLKTYWEAKKNGILLPLTPEEQRIVNQDEASRNAGRAQYAHMKAQGMARGINENGKSAWIPQKEWAVMKARNKVRRIQKL
jgi:hypothetical protein